jgi:spore coat polysaccharide biosynthesis protein SpsF
MIGCIIQARMGSTRLPGKVIQKIDGGKTVLDYVTNQLKASKKIDVIIIATTNLQEDDIIFNHSKSKQVKYYRGSSEDVLDRYYQCAKKFGIDDIIRITADNPLIDPNIIDIIIEKYKKEKYDFMTNALNRTFPYGTEVEIFSFETLEKTWKMAEKPSEREHVTPFMCEPKNNFRIINVKLKENFSYLRYTVDRIEDLELVKKIIKNIDERPILMKNIMNLHKKNPELFEINKHVQHDGHLSALKKDEEYFKCNKDNKKSIVKD